MPDPTVLCVLTFRRPDDLAAVVPMLVEQAGRALEAGVPTSVLIIDNDAEGSARAESERLAAAARPDVPVRYVCEPTPGIAAARNRALDEARSDRTRLLVFLDDDERPEPGWLAALLETHAAHSAEGCAAVAGAVIPRPGLIQDPWILAGGFFVRQRYATGTVVPIASTANLLLDLAELDRRGGIRFDESFGLSGGSDTVLTRQLSDAGGRIVWSDEAVVIDDIRADRLNRAWLLQRHYRLGNSWSRASVATAPGGWHRLVARVRLTVEGAARFVVGGLRAILGRISGSMSHRALGDRTRVRGAGMLAGAWGVVHIEYRKHTF